MIPPKTHHHSSEIAVRLFEFTQNHPAHVPVGCDPLEATLSAIFRHFCPHIRSLPFGSSLEIYKSPPDR
jgi:hypothetical protein